MRIIVDIDEPAPNSDSGIKCIRKVIEIDDKQLIRLGDKYLEMKAEKDGSNGKLQNK